MADGLGEAGNGGNQDIGVLCVDDDEMILEMLEWAFRDTEIIRDSFPERHDGRRLDLRTCASREVVQATLDAGFCPSVVLTDREMPRKFDPGEVVSMVSGVTKGKVAVILMAGRDYADVKSTLDDMDTTVFQAGSVLLFLAKPLRMHAVSELVHLCVSFALEDEEITADDLQPLRDQGLVVVLRGSESSETSTSLDTETLDTSDPADFFEHLPLIVPSGTSRVAMEGGVEDAKRWYEIFREAFLTEFEGLFGGDMDDWDLEAIHSFLTTLLDPAYSDFLAQILDAREYGREVGTYLFHDLRGNLNSYLEANGGDPSALRRLAYNAWRRLGPLNDCLAEDRFIEDQDLGEFLERNYEGVGKVDALKGVMVRVFPGWLDSTFYNLWENPRKVANMVERGTRRCSIDDFFVDVNVSVDGDEVSITFTDNAPGVPEELLNKLLTENVEDEEKGHSKGSGRGMRNMNDSTIILGGRVIIRQLQADETVFVKTAEGLEHLTDFADVVRETAGFPDGAIKQVEVRLPIVPTPESSDVEGAS